MQVLSEMDSKPNTSLAEGLMTPLNSSQAESFLPVSVTPAGAPAGRAQYYAADGHGETVALGLGVGQGELAYSQPVKATRPHKMLL